MQSWFNISLNTTNLSKTAQNSWAIGLIFLLGLTRFNHFGSIFALPDASWAVFFLAGFLVQKKLLFPLLMLEAIAVDYFALQQGVSNWCVSSAYAFLIPSYLALWCAGFFFNKKAKKQKQGGELSHFFAYAWVGITLAFFISNESFYRLSGKFSDLNWLDFYRSVLVYYGTYLLTTFCYIGVITSLVIAIELFPKKTASVK